MDAVSCERHPSNKSCQADKKINTNLITLTSAADTVQGPQPSVLAVVITMWLSSWVFSLYPSSSLPHPTAGAVSDWLGVAKLLTRVKQQESSILLFGSSYSIGQWQCLKFKAYFLFLFFVRWAEKIVWTCKYLRTCSNEIIDVILYPVKSN